MGLSPRDYKDTRKIRISLQESYNNLERTTKGTYAYNGKVIDAQTDS